MATSKIPVATMEWVNTSVPTNDELAQFVRDADLLTADAEFLLGNNHHPEIGFRDTYTLILLDIPVFDKKNRVTSGATLIFVATKERLFSLHLQPIVSLEKIRKEFEEKPQKHEGAAYTPVSLALYIIDQLNKDSLRKLQRLAKHIDIAEDAVFYGSERKMVEEVAILTRDVLDFRRIIRPHLHMFKEVPEFVDENTRAMWQHIHNRTNQIWEILSSLLDSTKELRDTNDSLLQHKENELLRLLSFYSIITIPLWIFVSPFSPKDSPLDAAVFWIVLLALALLLLGIFIRARRRKIL